MATCHRHIYLQADLSVHSFNSPKLSRQVWVDALRYVAAYRLLTSWTSLAVSYDVGYLIVPG